MISVCSYIFTEWENKHIFFYLQGSEKDTMKGIGCGLRCVKEGKKNVTRFSFIHSHILWTLTVCLVFYRRMGGWGTPDTKILTTEHWTWWYHCFSKGDGLINNIRSLIILHMLHLQRKSVNWMLTFLGKWTALQRKRIWGKGQQLALNIPVGMPI